MKRSLPFVAAALPLLAALVIAPAAAQNVARGARLFADTPGVTGRPVAACAGCHGNVEALRQMIANRGGKPDDARALARWLGAVFDGVQPRAATAKAQYRNVLTPADLRDLAAYLARSERAAADTPGPQASAPAAIGRR